MHIPRNQLCPCGGGKKYKNCHGSLSNDHLRVESPDASIQEALVRLRNKIDLRNKLLSEHGAVKEPLYAEVNNARLVAVGKRVIFQNCEKLLNDFLISYLANCMGGEWGGIEMRLPFGQQHPIAQWYSILSEKIQNCQTDVHGVYKVDIGAAHAWIRLAHDLYLIEHNSVLQRKLIRRLRDKRSFQGARFEVAVAAIMLAAGYELYFSSEKGPGKHPEFLAVNKFTGQKLAVEAKSRHRSGIMGLSGVLNYRCEDEFDIDRLLLNAVNKNTVDPLLIFIELNSPFFPVDDFTQQDINELDASWRSVQAKSWSEGFPAIGVVFYNDVSPWMLEADMPERNSVWAYGCVSDSHRHKFDGKQLLQFLVRAVIQRTTVPQPY